jgi:CheY-like chemotaxis protein
MDILIIDDEGNLRRMLRSLLEGEGYTIREAGSAEAGIEEVRQEAPEAILLDLMLPGMTGLEALPKIGDLAPGVPVVMMSGKATLGDAVQATRLGAFHFIEKPLTPEAVLLTVRGALEVSRARDLSRALREELGPEAEMVGRAPAINRVRDLIQRVAPTDARVLITGESGTGKELVASAIHALSPRKGRPFVRVNSAAIPKDLVESEMFGHERGAFTGATERRRGRFELANRGTLFLDEVGDLGPEAQAKLLRAIETGVVERVGGGKTIEADVRVLAATNHDLRDQVEKGASRTPGIGSLEQKDGIGRFKLEYGIASGAMGATGVQQQYQDAAGESAKDNAGAPSVRTLCRVNVYGVCVSCTQRVLPPAQRRGLVSAEPPSPPRVRVKGPTASVAGSLASAGGANFGRRQRVVSILINIMARTRSRPLAGADYQPRA